MNAMTIFSAAKEYRGGKMVWFAEPGDYNKGGSIPGGCKILNPYNVYGWAFAGDLCEVHLFSQTAQGVATGATCYLFKTFVVAANLAADATTLKIVADPYSHPVEVGNILMKKDGVSVGGTKAVYTLTISTAPAAGDTIAIGGVNYVYAATEGDGTYAIGSNATDAAKNIEDAVSAQYDGVFSVIANHGKLVFTQLVAGVGAVPVVSVTRAAETGTMVAAIATTTAGVAASTYSKGGTIVAVEERYDTGLSKNIYECTIVAGTLGTLTAGDVLVEAASAGSNVLPLVTNPNAFIAENHEFKLTTSAYPILSNVTEYINPILHGAAYKARMQALPAYALVNNKSLVEGIYEL